MSIIVAVRKKGTIVIAGDVQSNFGTLKFHSNNCRSKKIKKISDSYIGTTGWSVYENILEDYVHENDNPDFFSSGSIFSFFMKFWKELAEKYSYINAQAEDDQSPFADLGADFLITNKTGIYYVASDLSITKFEYYYAIGSGSDFSLGVLHALYESLDAVSLAKKAIKAAVNFDSSCGGDAEIFELKAEEKIGNNIKSPDVK